MPNHPNENLICSPFEGLVVHRQKNPPNSSKFGQNWLCVLAAISQRATDMIFILKILHSYRITIHDLTKIWLCTSTKSKWSLGLCVQSLNDFAIFATGLWVGASVEWVKYGFDEMGCCCYGDRL